MNIKTPLEIEQVLKTGQYKYLELIANGKKYGGYNRTPKELKTKVESIKKFIETLPDGIYTLNFKISPSGDIFTYPYSKGNLSESITPIMYQQTPPAAIPLEKFQTLDEWKKQEQKISDLERELAILKITNELKQPLAEQEPEKNIFLGFAENILPSFMPVLDKYFMIKERELAIKEKNGTTPKPQQQATKKVIKTTPGQNNAFRPVPEIGAPAFINYINYFLNLDEDKAEQELVFLEQKNPSIYNYITANYYENETGQDI